MKLSSCVLPMMLLATTLLFGQKNKKAVEPETPKKEELSLSGLKFRNIGPALTSGRIADLAVNPTNHSEYYVAVASGGVWKTINSGTTYEPIFDSQGSYSIGCITIDPNNPNVVWVGTGENNNQRSIAYGDGVYKSEDGGKSWKNTGLKTSEHIGKIIVDPRNSNIVFVAAIGPLWKEGGERGVYKTTDGGTTWELVLKVDEHTGATDLVMDPRFPDVLYAAMHQRRRHDYGYVSGGPGSDIYKSVDGGKTWSKSSKGLPSVDKGRIGLAISPADPEYIYAIVEAARDEGGFYRSTNRGASWEKRGSHSTSGNYYSEVICDPSDRDRLYSMTVFIQVSEDGGKTWSNAGEKSKHVDNHALWIDPKDSDHMLNGNDGGIYETWDRAKTWQYKPNLPITQFYKVEVDNSEPFYYVYGGTQDNFSLGGPSRTRNENGITNADWFVTNGGDGFESAIDPYNPNIVYAQSQHGGLVRFDKATGETTGIQPKPVKGENSYRWNWDAPLSTSVHKKGRIYFAANKVFRSDDYGSTWAIISNDVTRQLNRNTLPFMGRIWSMDAPGKNDGAALYGTVSAFSESPKNENVLIIGTDDGLIQVTKDGGNSWKKYESFSGVPSMTYVYHVVASQHNENVMYAVFNNHKQGDFKPYVYKSSDGGNSWSSITSNLPERGSTFVVVEDHVDPNLLFVATEFGVHFSNDGGANWKALKSGLPTIAVRDLAIQKRENDLVLASFGRSFYVLDDYSPLRNLRQTEGKEAFIFPIKDSWMYIENSPLGIRDKGFMGESYYGASNPKVGAVFTYFLKDEYKSKKEQRQDAEGKLEKDKKDVTYPTYDKLKDEQQEESAYLLFTIRNEQGTIIRKLTTSIKKGVQRMVWDFRYPSSNPINLSRGSNDNPFQSNDVGQLAAPGNYAVSLSKFVDGNFTELHGPEKFTVKVLPGTTLPASSRPALVAWQREAAELQRSIQAASRILGETNNRIKHLKEAMNSISTPHTEFLNDFKNIEAKLNDIQIKLSGDRTANQLDLDTTPSINSRLFSAIYDGYGTTGDPTTTMKTQLQIAGEEFEVVLATLKSTVEVDLKNLETKLEAAGAPFTPGRLPDWKKN
ncbi:MAG: glycosyl hydrolase [Flammeovirgaceae bacterium]|nr:glycosyl hydrolase [Flammeovirgaceae bacterium]